VTMKREGNTVTITKGAGGPAYRYQVVAERGPHLLLRKSQAAGSTGPI
jgi:hypothetical protein